jgi:hypothetical protein
MVCIPFVRSASALRHVSFLDELLAAQILTDVFLCVSPSPGTPLFYVLLPAQWRDVLVIIIVIIIIILAGVCTCFALLGAPRAILALL